MGSSGTRGTSYSTAKRISSQTVQKAEKEPRLRRLAREAYRDVVRMKPGGRVPPIEVQFYAYAGLRSTVRLREGQIYLRLTDLFVDAPDEPLGALMRILLAKLLRRRVRKEWNAAYHAHTASDEMMAASEDLRRQRGSKRVAPAKGRTFDLDRVFDRLNLRYFDGSLERPKLGWTLRDSWRTHGHYDPAHDTIVLSRTLDDPMTPAYVIEFVLYHEMLHVAMPAEVQSGRRRHHTAAFRAAEARHPRMGAAVEWLEKFSAMGGTRRRRRRLRGRG